MPFPALGNVTIGVSTDLTALDRGLKTAGSMLQGFGKMVMGGAAFGFGMNLTRAIFGSPAEFITDAIRLAAEFETAQTQFSVMLGQNEQKAEKMMANLRRFAAESPLTLTTAVEEARKLLSAGIEEGQIVPTLRVLSDLAVGSHQKLRMLSVAYTQVIAAGRLYGTELRQFTETGIPLVEALADVLTERAKAQGLEAVKVADVRTQMEAGAVTARDLQLAMKLLTTEGSKFFDMTKRGSMTTEGMMERVKDGWEEFKRSFGRAVIEESGFKDVLSDLTKFESEITRMVDMGRPFIRFVADVGKGVAQVFGEIVRNGPLAMGAFADTVRLLNPNAAKFMDSVGSWLTKLQDLRADPKLWVDIAIDMGEAFSSSIGTLFDVMAEGINGVYTRELKPIFDEVKSVADLWRSIRETVTGVSEPLKGAGGALYKQLHPDFAKASPELRIDAMRDRLNRYRGFLEQSPGGAEYTQRANAYNSAVEAWKKARDLHAAPPSGGKGINPLTGMPYSQEIPKASIEAALTAAEQLMLGLPAGVVPDQKGKPSGPSFFGQLRTLWRERAGQMQAARFGTPEENARTAQMSLFGGMGAAGPMQQTTDALNLLGGAAMGTAHTLGAMDQKFKEMDDAGQEFQKTAEEVRKNFVNPARTFAERQNQLLGAKRFGLVGDDQFTRAMAASIRDAQQGLGRIELAPGAEAGSAAVAEAYSKLVGGVGGETATNLLGQLVELNKQQLEADRQLVESFRQGGGLTPALQLPPR